MATSISKIRVRPAKDEWGVYDPQQAGIAALFARLDNNKGNDQKNVAAEKLAATPAKETKDAAPRPRPIVRDAQ
jgi:hypothetical protein